ncbi:MAG: glycosyltransferase [Verrucomicrobiota bacterium]
MPNGVALPNRKPLEEREKVILFFSRLHPMKGLGALIEGWARIASDFPDWRVDVAGWEEGGYGRECEVLAKRLGLSRQIRFVGPKFGPEKADCLASVAGLAQPSLNEGLPMSILEAWSYGTPTLMSDHCHLPEGFQRGAAIKINPTSESVAEGLRRFLSLGELDRGNMGAAGRTLVEERFRWGEVGQRFLEIYEEMAG